MPLPVYPFLHWHRKPPGRFRHSASLWQLLVPAVHSLTSTHCGCTPCVVDWYSNLVQMNVCRYALSTLVTLLTSHCFDIFKLDVSYKEDEWRNERKCSSSRLVSQETSAEKTDLIIATVISRIPESLPIEDPRVRRSRILESADRGSSAVRGSSPVTEPNFLISTS
jgi:hypothetical protein